MGRAFDLSAEVGGTIPGGSSQRLKQINPLLPLLAFTIHGL